MNWKTLAGVGILVAFLIIGYGVYQSITTLTESAKETMETVKESVNQTAAEAQETMKAAQESINATTEEAARTMQGIQKTVNETEKAINATTKEAVKTMREVQETANVTKNAINDTTTPPKIYEVNVETTKTTATITWKTDKESTSTFRITEPFQRPDIQRRSGTEFSVPIELLRPGTNYTYEIIAETIAMTGIKTTYTGSFKTEELIEGFDLPRLR